MVGMTVILVLLSFTVVEPAPSLTPIPTTPVLTQRPMGDIP